MARDLLDLPVPDGPLADPDDPKVTHAFKRENDKIKVETHAGDKIYRSRSSSMPSERATST